MNKRELQLKAESFLQVTKDRLAALPRAEVETWPDWPGIPPFSLEVPQDSSALKFTFTLMKETFSDGRIRIAVQCYRYRFLGMGWMFADGFILSPDGCRSNLTEQDIWDVT